MVCQGHQRQKDHPRRLFCGSGKDQKSPSVIPLDIEPIESSEIPAENDLSEELVESSIEPSSESPELEAADFTALEVAEIPGEEADWDPLAAEEIEVEKVLEDLTNDSSSLTSEQPAANSQEEETSEETTEITTETSSAVEPSLEVSSEETESIDPVAESELEEDTIDPVTENESEPEEDAIVAEADETDTDTESSEVTDEDPEDEDAEDTLVDIPLLLSDVVGGLGTVTDPSGQLSVIWKFDGGAYEGQVGVVSTAGLENYDLNSIEFMQEALRRALANIVVDDTTEGSEFSGNMGDGDSNHGEFTGEKIVQLSVGEQFFFVVIPNGTFTNVLASLEAGEVPTGSIRPLFSLTVANPDSMNHFVQVVDLTGKGSTFALEDISNDQKSDWDLNDIIITVKGADLDAPTVGDLIDAGVMDQEPWWREGEVWKTIVESVVDTIAEEYDFPKEDQPLIGFIDTHLTQGNPDIDYSRIIFGKDWIENDSDPTVSSEEGGHADHSHATAGEGTHLDHILEIVGATRNNGVGIDGINDVAPLWVSSAVESGKWADALIDFVDTAIASNQPNAVINLSIDLTQVNPDGSVTTRYEFTPQERGAIEYARQSGVLIVAAAGNDGGVMSVLGQASQEFDNIITVGAADGMARAAYSSYGYGLDIMAPGGSIDNPILSNAGDGLGTMAGTSVATAQVTGAASQVWAANPELSYRQVIEILKETATDINTPGWDEETGTGLLNITAAVGLAKITTPGVYNPESFLIPTTWDGSENLVPSERAVSTEYGNYNPNVSTNFLNKVKTIGLNLGLTPEYLMAVMGFETGGTYSPSIRNPVSGATGLIQFMPSTAIGLGTSVSKLAQMTAIEQLDYVEKYLRPYKGRFSTLEDAYMAVLWPVAVGKGSNYVLFRSGTIQYTQNSGLDANRDGVVTASEAANKVRKYLPPASLFDSQQNNGSSSTFSGKVQNAGYVQQVGFVRVRSGPGTTGYTEVARLNPGDTRQFSGETQGQWVADPNMQGGGSSIWYRLADGSGYVSGQYIEKLSLDRTVGYDGTSTHQTYINTFNRIGGEAVLGLPLNNVHPWENGYAQDFPGRLDGKGAIMKSNTNDNSYWVGGDLWTTFLGAGGAGGILQYPTSDRYATNSGWRQNFQGGAILKSSKGIFPLYGGIGSHYLNNENGEKGRLGFPTSGEVSIGGGVIIQNFENGRIIYGAGPTRTEMNGGQSITINSYIVSGNFYPVFKNYQGTLGNPISGVTNHSSGVTYQLFQNGSIVSSKNGTFPLYGSVRQTYLNNGGLNGFLGAPTSAEIGMGNGVTKQTFEGGYIIWNGRTATAYRTGTSQPTPVTGSWQSPLANYRITGTFTGAYPNHQGMDLAANLGTPVEAAKSGTVSFVGWYPSNLHNGGYGLYVKINHGNGEETVYAHLSQTLVTVGQQVTADTVIGKVGSTGNSTGPHLHFEVRVNGLPRNPQNYIQF